MQTVLLHGNDGIGRNACRFKVLLFRAYIGTKLRRKNLLYNYTINANLKSEAF